MDGFEKDVLTQSIVELDEDEFPKIFTDKRFLARKIADVHSQEEFKEKYFRRSYMIQLREVLMNQNR